MTINIDKLTQAERARKRLQDQAHGIGVTEAFIRNVVSTFYGKIRTHPALGPIFDDSIGDDWDTHLETMERFWCSVALNLGTYSGKPVQTHMALPRIAPHQFGVWLGLFEQTLDELAPTPDAKSHMLTRAQRIADTLEKAVAKRGTYENAP